MSGRNRLYRENNGSRDVIAVLVVSAALLVAIAIALVTVGDRFANPTVGPGKPAGVGAGPAEGPVPLDSALSVTGLPKEYDYSGRTWRASGAERSPARDTGLAPAGGRANGRTLYYRKGSDEAGSALYLVGTTAEYGDVRVRYEPVREKTPRQPARGQAQSRPAVPGMPSCLADARVSDPDEFKSTAWDMGMPSRFSYDGRRWRAIASGPYAATGCGLVRTEGITIEGFTLYHSSESSKPYPVMFLKAPGDDTYVMYRPASG
jgi:hypothetical protein